MEFTYRVYFGAEASQIRESEVYVSKDNSRQLWSFIDRLLLSRQLTIGYNNNKVWFLIRTWHVWCLACDDSSGPGEDVRETLEVRWAEVQRTPARAWEAVILEKT